VAVTSSTALLIYERAQPVLVRKRTEPQARFSACALGGHVDFFDHTGW
jgi:hypothetical protein